MDILIQRDGRIQTNVAINPDHYEYRTVEFVPMDYIVAQQLPAADFPPRRLPTIDRRFRRVYRDSNISVWVEQ